MRGGARSGSGPKPGAKYRRRLKLTNTETVFAAKPTAAERMRALKRHVVLCIADGMEPDKIAALLGMPIDKLRAVFAHELEHGREIVRAEELRRLDEQSGAGKTAATKTLLDNAGAKGAPPKPQSEEESRADKIMQGALRLLQGGKK